jgi:hypothetical protein
MKYEEFKSTPVLYEAYKKTRRGKRSKKAEAIFESSETENLKRIARQIDKGYLPAGLDSFMIYEPKARTINAPAFRDKIVQRDLTDNVIYPALVKSIPFNAFAAQSRCGTIFSNERPLTSSVDGNSVCRTAPWRNGIIRTAGWSRAMCGNALSRPTRKS